MSSLLRHSLPPLPLRPPVRRAATLMARPALVRGGGLVRARSPSAALRSRPLGLLRPAGRPLPRLLSCVVLPRGWLSRGLLPQTMLPGRLPHRVRPRTLRLPDALPRRATRCGGLPLTGLPRALPRDTALFHLCLRPACTA
ncbi:hypothetical protein CLV68_0060 [Actinokineospora cianjurensis]|uniref:Uncharacterized protein n=1 Tax=Actinokineospora cianjurensis TaxID=585224 RepID=A0A421B5B7_9PSEU|nr:hypothetical protein CLV68_0060 [Actinokineospora cianjurensis]